MAILLGGGGGHDLGLDDLGERVHRGITTYAGIKHQRKIEDQGDRSLDQAQTRIEQGDRTLDQQKERDEQRKREHDDDEAWRKWHKEQAELEKAERRQANARAWGMIFPTEERPEGLYGPPAPNWNEESAIPASIQKAAYDAINDPLSTVDERQNAAKALKHAAISRRAGDLRRRFERVAMPNPEAQGPRQDGSTADQVNREQMVPFEIADKAIEQLKEEERNPTGNVNLDELDSMLDSAIKAEAYRRAEYEQNDAAVERIDNVMRIRRQRSMEDGMAFGSAPSFDPDADIEASAIREQIAAYGITGRALAAAEQKVYDLLSGRKSRSTRERASWMTDQDEQEAHYAKMAKDYGYEGQDAEAFVARRMAGREDQRVSTPKPYHGLPFGGGDDLLGDGNLLGQNGAEQPQGGANLGAQEVQSLDQAIAEKKVDPKNPKQVEAWLRANVSREQAAQIAGVGDGKPKAPEQSSEPKLIRTMSEKSKELARAAGSEKATGRSVLEVRMEGYRKQANEDVADIVKEFAKVKAEYDRALQVSADVPAQGSLPSQYGHGDPKVAEKAKAKLAPIQEKLMTAIGQYEQEYGDLPDDLKAQIISLLGGVR